MLYDVKTHPLLSAEAKRLTDEPLRQQIELAEDLLGLSDISEVTDPVQLARVKKAVVLQVNWQVLLDPDALMLKSKSVGAESESYRDNIALTNLDAVAILEPILPTTEVQASGKWEPIRKR
jgi:hypothetical protein